MATTYRIEEFEDRSYDPFMADAVNFGDDLDPYPRIHALRAQGALLPGCYCENGSARAITWVMALTRRLHDRVSAVTLRIN